MNQCWSADGELTATYPTCWITEDAGKALLGFGFIGFPSRDLKEDMNSFVTARSWQALTHSGYETGLKKTQKTGDEYQTFQKKLLDFLLSVALAFTPRCFMKEVTALKMAELTHKHIHRVSQTFSCHFHQIYQGQGGGSMGQKEERTNETARRKR